MKIYQWLWVMLAFFVLTRICPAQASPYNLYVVTPQSFTATGQTGALIPTNGLAQCNSTTIASAYSYGTVTLAGTGLTIASFQLMASSDNGGTFYPLLLWPVAAPSSTATTITATANGTYGFNPGTASCLKLVTTSTFTAASITLTVALSPNAQTGKGSSGGAGSGVYPSVYISGQDPFTSASNAGSLPAANLSVISQFGHCNPSTVGLPNLVYPNCSAQYVEFAAISNGYDEFINGTPSFKTNWGALSLGNGYFNTQGQDNMGGYTLHCYASSSDCLDSPGYFGYVMAAPKNNADEGAHPGPLQTLQVGAALLIKCASGCGTGVTSMTFTPVTADALGVYDGQIGDDQYIEDIQNPILSSTIGSHIIFGQEQGSPQSYLQLSANWATNSWLGISSTPAIALFAGVTLSRSGGTVTATGSFVPAMAVGAKITPVGSGDSSFNGVFTLVTSNSSTMTWAQTGSTATTTSIISTQPIGAIGTVHIPIQTFPAWSSSTTYTYNQVVSYSGSNYISNVSTNLNENPASTSGYWEQMYGFQSSTSGLASSGIACVDDAGAGAGPSYYETVPYTVIDGTSLQMTFLKPHPSQITIGIGGLCQSSIYPNAHLYGSLASGAIGQSNTIVGNYGPYLYLGDFAGARAISVNSGGESEINYVSEAETATTTRTANVATFTTSTILDVNQKSVAITGCSDTSFNSSSVIATQTGVAVFTYPNSGSNGSTTGCTFVYDNAEYTIVPKVRILQTANQNHVNTNPLLGPVGQTMPAVDGLISLYPNSLTLNTTDQLLVQSDPSVAVSSQSRWNLLCQYTPQRDYYALNVAGDDGTLCGRPGPSMFQYLSLNAGNPTIYHGLGGDKNPPLTSQGSSGVYTWNHDEVYAGLGGFATIGCKPMPIGCNSFNSNYDLFQLSGNGFLGIMNYDPVTNSLIWAGQGTPANFATQNLHVTGTATFDQPLTFPSGVSAGPYSGNYGENYRFLDTTQATKSSMGLCTVYSWPDLCVYNSNQTQDGNNQHFAPDITNSNLWVANFHADNSGEIANLSVGYGLPLTHPTPVNNCTSGCTSAFNYYFYALFPNGTRNYSPTGEFIGSTSITGGNTITINMPSALQPGYPSGTLYGVYRQTEGNVISDLGTGSLGGTIVDNGSVTAAISFPTNNYTASGGAFGWTLGGLPSQPCLGTSSAGLIQAGTCGALTGLTTNVIPKALSASTAGDSLLTDNATTLTYLGSGGFSTTGPVSGASGVFGNPSAGAQAALPSGAHGQVCDSSTTAGVPFSAGSYLRCDTSLGLVASVLGAVETPVATVAAAQALINKSVNGVTLSTAGPATQYLDKTGNYSTPSGGSIGSGAIETHGYDGGTLLAITGGQTFCAAVEATSTQTSGHLTIYWQTTPNAANIDLGIYGGPAAPTPGALIAHIGAQTTGLAGGVTYTWSGGTHPIYGGKNYVCGTGASGIGTTNFIAYENVFSLFPWASVSSPTTGGVLNSTITLPADNITRQTTAPMIIIW